MCQMTWQGREPMRSPASGDCSDIEGVHGGCRAKQQWVQSEHEQWLDPCAIFARHGNALEI